MNFHTVLFNATMDKRLAVAFPTASDSSAFAVYLRRMDAAMLAELIPGVVRRLLISDYVAKVEKFWSPDRCALVKVQLKISNPGWVWMRQLLGRSINDEGKVLDHEIDGVAIPLLRGKHTLIKYGETAANAQGITELNSPSSHGGLVSFRNARSCSYYFHSRTLHHDYSYVPVHSYVQGSSSRYDQRRHVHTQR